MAALRPGQPRRKARDVFYDGTGRMLVSARSAAAIEHRHVNVIRRAAEPVACDVATGALLWDAVELAAALRTVDRGLNRQRGTDGKFVTSRD